MPALITYLLILFLGLFGLFTAIEFIIYRSVKKFVIQAVVLIGVVLGLKATTGFPNIVVAFGGISPIIAIGIMFVCTTLGIFANYFFYRKGRFSWRSFLKPLIISPIVLLPLIGTVQSVHELEEIQLVLFGMLAFQNGFFWRVILERGKSNV